MKKSAVLPVPPSSSAGLHSVRVLGASSSRRALAYGKLAGQKPILALLNYSGYPPETSSVRPKSDIISILTIERLIQYGLSSPITITLEPDDDGFIARTVELPLYGFADTPVEAVTCLKKEIETLYDDLKKDDEFSPEWLQHKKYLTTKIIATQA